MNFDIKKKKIHKIILYTMKMGFKFNRHSHLHSFHTKHSLIYSQLIDFSYSVIINHIGMFKQI